MARSITLYGFKKAVGIMVTRVDEVPINHLKNGDEAVETSIFTTSNLKVSFSVIKVMIPLFEPDEFEMRYRMTISWVPTTHAIPNYWVQERFAQALSAFMNATNNTISMSLEAEIIPIMYKKLQMVLDAEMCSGCSTNVVPQGLIECYACIMRLEKKDDNQHMCGVCKETCCAKIEKMSCCGQHIHRVCKNKWYGDCPFCRAPRTT